MVFFSRTEHGREAIPHTRHGRAPQHKVPLIKKSMQLAPLAQAFEQALKRACAKRSTVPLALGLGESQCAGPAGWKEGSITSFPATQG